MSNKKDVLDIARELAELSELARERKLKAGDMQGGCFTISSLGGIGGTAFTPIINAPEVAILGVSRRRLEAGLEQGRQAFVPRLMLPLSLSYDHRVIDGADGARFTSLSAPDAVGRPPAAALTARSRLERRMRQHADHNSIARTRDRTMSQSIEIKVPDIGDFKDVEIIEVLVKPGRHASPRTPP